MAFVPSYKDTEWQVYERRASAADLGGTAGISTIQIRVKEGEEWRDYWVPQDPANSDFAQYQEWLAEGNEPRIIL